MKRTIKKNVYTMLLAAALIIPVLVYISCASLESVVTEPSVSFENVSITRINFNSVDLNARLRIQNDNSFAIPFPEINWNLFVSDTSFLSGVVRNNNRIAARGSSMVDLPISVSYEGLFNTFAVLLNSDQAPYRIDMGVRFSIPMLESRTYNFSHSGSIPLLRMPSLSFSGIRFNTVSLSRVEFTLTWQMDNRNSFAINLEKLDYTFSVNHSPWTTGSAEHITLPARRVTDIPVTVNINSLSMIQEIAALAALGRSVNYTCTGGMSISPQLQGFGNIAAINLPFNYSGTTNLRP